MEVGVFKENSGESKDYYHFADDLGWSNDDIKKFFEVYYLDIIKRTTIKPEVQSFFRNLKNQGNDIYIISSRRKRAENEIEKITENWLKENDVIYDKLFINIKEKYKLVNEYGIDIFVDDSYKICKDIQLNTDAKVYMIQNKYNENIQDDSIQKIKTLSEIL